MNTKVLYVLAAATACVAVLLLLFASQSWWISSDLNWLNRNRGSLLQAIIYAAQTVLLILVFWASLTQLRTLEKSIHSSSLESMFSAQREIARLAADQSAIISRLARDQEPQQDTDSFTLQTFADTLVNFTYSIFLQHKLSAIPGGYWESAIKSAANVFALPYVKRRWEGTNRDGVKRFYEREFCEFVGSLTRRDES